MKKNIRIIIFLIIIFSLLLSGCSKKEAANRHNEEYYSSYYVSEDEAAYEFEDAMVDTMSAAYADNDYAAKSVPAAVNETGTTQNRMIKKSASINIQVMDPVQAADAIIDLAEKMGGFVVSSSSSQEHYSGDIYLPKADLTIRVPSEKLNETLEFIESQTTDTSKYVSNKRVYGVDITSEYVDTNSRLASLEKTRDKLYEIMDTAANAEEALEVYNNIADVESEIEIYKGQRKYMEESVALSSIDIKITSIRPAPIQTVSKWSPGDTIKDAFETLLDAGQSVVEFLIYFIIVVVPILILIAIPIVLIVILIKKLIKNRKTKKTASTEKAEDELTAVVKK